MTMPAYDRLTPQFDGEETNTEFPYEGVTASAAITAIGQGHYRLDTVPVLIESAGFRDTPAYRIRRPTNEHLLLCD